MSLYSVVRLKDSKENFVVKTTWCKGMNDARTKNYGNRSTIQRLIFFSPNQFSEPDFTLQVRAIFNPKYAACYKGYVTQTFSKFEIDIFDYFNYRNIINSPNYIFRRQS